MVRAGRAVSVGLAALSVRHRPEILCELRAIRAERGLTFGGAIRVIADLTGDSESVLRESSLCWLGDRLRARYTSAKEALRWLATLDLRLAVWGACAYAREALRCVPAGEDRPRVSIETYDEVAKAAAGAGMGHDLFVREMLATYQASPKKRG